MIIVDVHAHLDFEEYNQDIDKVIEENMKAGVAAIINKATRIPRLSD